MVGNEQLTTVVLMDSFSTFTRAFNVRQNTSHKKIAKVLVFTPLLIIRSQSCHFQFHFT